MNDAAAIPPAARRLVTHLRRCCSALADGVSRDPFLSPARWRARWDIDARWWRHPVLTPKIREDCATLHIELPGGGTPDDGVEQLAALLRASELRLPEIQAGPPLAAREILVPHTLTATDYPATPFAALPDAFDALRQQPLPGLSLFLHGSMADRTFTAFSDASRMHPAASNRVVCPASQAFATA